MYESVYGSGVVLEKQSTGQRSKAKPNTKKPSRSYCKERKEGRMNVMEREREREEGERGGGGREGGEREGGL